ncbi:hypothetical protein DOY81_004642 [Sarcophaga bullata]|nr:hypothetical protein DOY81_004642 [Sarcophaga bullata]
MMAIVTDPKASEFEPLNSINHDDSVVTDPKASEFEPLNSINHDDSVVMLTNNEKASSATSTGSTTVCQYEPKESFVITKNVVMMGLAFMIHFTAFHGTFNLQSSVHEDKTLGSTSLAVTYVSIILSNIFLPMPVIRCFGVKLTMALAFFAYMPYIMAQFYPRFYTLIPGGIIMSIGSGPLWCAQSTYLSIVAEALAKVRDQKSSKDVNTVRLFGLFLIFYEMAEVWGNLISSSVLTLASGTNEVETSINANLSEDLVEELCGARFCPDVKVEENANLIPPEPSKIRLLNSIFLVFIAVAFIMIMFGVDSLKRYGVKKNETGGEGISGFELLIATLSMLKKKRQLLMVPITVFLGLEEAFAAVDFTESFVACGWGIPNIGFVMIFFGAADAIAAGIAGGVAKKLGRVKLAILCALTNLTLLVYMLVYKAKQGDYINYCLIAALWGTCDGVWTVVINSFYGIIFPKNLVAGYSNFRLWKATGCVIGYAISSRLCTYLKLFILITVLLLGCTGYGICEYRFWKKQIYLDVMLSEK